MTRAALSFLLILAACGTPQDRCLRDYGREIQTVDALIVETQQNITRGYRYVTETRDFGYGVTFCTGGYRHRGGARFCGGNDTRTVRRPEAIDSAAERRKLASLQARRDELEKQRSAVVAQCQALPG